VRRPVAAKEKQRGVAFHTPRQFPSAFSAPYLCHSLTPDLLAPVALGFNAPLTLPLARVPPARTPPSGRLRAAHWMGDDRGDKRQRQGSGGFEAQSDRYQKVRG